MPKYLPLIVTFTLLGFLIYKFLSKDSPFGITDVTINNEKFALEIAKNLNQKSRGLSGRSKICQNCGMIFVYTNEGTYSFWMKDTLIPLDMIWINNEGIVTDIITANPEPDTPITQLTLYQNTKPARYIIELNANRAKDLGLKIGDRIWTNPPIFQ